MIRSWFLVLVLSGGCAASTSFSSVRIGNAGPERRPDGAAGTAIVPNVVLLPRAQAEAVLRNAGFTAPVELDTSACGSTVDNKHVVELGHVCYQMPAAGRQGSTRIPVTLRVQHEDPWRGAYSSGRTWFLMPDLAGVPVETARARLRAAGFAKEPLISYVVEAGCRPNVVCRTTPEPLSRADSSSDKVLVVGQPPERVSNQPAPTPAPTPAPPPVPEPAKSPTDIF